MPVCNPAFIDAGFDLVRLQRFASWSCWCCNHHRMWPLTLACPLWNLSSQFSWLRRSRTQVELRAHSEGLSVCERSLIVWWCCSTYAGCVNMVAVVKALLHCGLLVGWSVMEKGHPWATRWWCCGCVLVMYTSGFSCHTPPADMIKWVWLENLYLVDVFHVVYEVICVSPLRSLFNETQNPRRIHNECSDSYTGNH